MGTEGGDDWSKLWDARLSALEIILGRSDDRVLHGVIPFHLGYENGGRADVVSFRQQLDGIAYVTADLIGCDEQKQNMLGNYELMICQHEESDWGPKVICMLAHYTLEAVIEPGHTMDIGPATPDDSTIVALLFDNYAEFDVQGSRSGLLLCLGITAEELEESRSEGADIVIQKLKDAGIYPFTDLYRESVIR